MPGLIEGILGSLLSADGLSTCGLGLLIIFLWRSVQELKAERAIEREQLTALSTAHKLAQREQEAAHKATLNKLERDHVITIQALAEAKDAEIALLQEALLDETRRRLRDKADYEKQFTATAERIERLLLEWQARHT